MPPLIDLTGRRFGRLVIIARAPTATTSTGHPRTCWQARCDCGQTVTVRGGQLQQGRVKSCGCLHVLRAVRMGRANRREVVAYYGAHTRLTRERGRAADRTCIDCNATAEQWSFDGCGAPMSGPGGMPYCLHGEHYKPRCRSCHTILDQTRGADGRFLSKATSR